MIESAKLNGYDPWPYLKVVFERLSTLKDRGLEMLLPHNWRPRKDDPASNGSGSATAAAAVAAEPGTAN